MIIYYNLVLQNKIPKLQIIKKGNYSNHDVSLEEIVNILNDSENLLNLYTEHSYVIGLNNKMNILGIYNVSIGNGVHCYFYTKEILIFLLLTGANKFILVHNHPSDILEASKDDVTSMLTLEQYSHELEIELVDSLIISKSGWYSIKSQEGDSYDDVF